MSKATAKKLHLRSRRVGRVTGKGGTVRLKLTATARKALKRARSVSLTLTVSAPGAKTVTKIVKVRR